MKWYAGSDHAGYRLKAQLCEDLRALGDEVVDLGVDSAEQSVDYPDYGAEVGRRVADDGEAFGLLVCGTGIGIAIAANKIPGVRAAVVTDAFTGKATRAHNDANIIAFGERVTGYGVAREALLAFRATEFEGGRHQRRVDKLGALEQA
jgi:ribose 5-phosphate isomerase B